LKSYGENKNEEDEVDKKRPNGPGSNEEGYSGVWN